MEPVLGNRMEEENAQSRDGVRKLRVEYCNSREISQRTRP